MSRERELAQHGLSAEAPSRNFADAGSKIRNVGEGGLDCMGGNRDKWSTVDRGQHLSDRRPGCEESGQPVLLTTIDPALVAHCKQETCISAPGYVVDFRMLVYCSNH